MVRIRLQRHGRKRLPYFHIVAADSRDPRDGKIIEDLGRFSPIREKSLIKLNTERVVHWLNSGAQPSDTVKNILKKEGIYYRLHLQRWGKSEEEIEKTITEWQSGKTTEAAQSKSEHKKAVLKAEEEAVKKHEAEAQKAAEKKAADEAKAKEKEAKEAEEAAKAEEKAAEAPAEKLAKEEAAAEEKSAADAGKTEAKEIATPGDKVAAADKEEPKPTKEQEKRAEKEASIKVEPSGSEAKAASEKVVSAEQEAKEEKQKEAKAEKPAEEKKADEAKAPEAGEKKEAKASDKTEEKK